MFTDGWSPSITEPELIGIMNSINESELEPEDQMRPHNIGHSNNKRNDFTRSSHFDDSDEYEDNNLANAANRGIQYDIHC